MTELEIVVKTIKNAHDLGVPLNLVRVQEFPPPDGEIARETSLLLCRLGNLALANERRIAQAFVVDFAPFFLVHGAHGNGAPFSVLFDGAFENARVETGTHDRVVIGARDLGCVHEVVRSSADGVGAAGDKGIDKLERHLAAYGETECVTNDSQHQPRMLNESAEHPIGDRPGIIADERDSTNGRQNVGEEFSRRCILRWKKNIAAADP